MREVPVAASASSAEVGTLDGPAPKRPSAGLIDAGISISVMARLCQQGSSGQHRSTPWQAAAVQIRRLPITHPDAALLVEQVQEEYVERYGSRDDTPIEPGYFDPPDGAFFVGYDARTPVATGAWRRRSDVPALGTTDTAEIKRMYVVRGRRARAPEPDGGTSP